VSEGYRPAIPRSVLLSVTIRTAEPRCRLCIHIPHYPHPNPNANPIPNPKPNPNPKSYPNLKLFRLVLAWDRRSHCKNEPNC